VILKVSVNRNKWVKILSVDRNFKYDSWKFLNNRQPVLFMSWDILFLDFI